MAIHVETNSKASEEEIVKIFKDAPVDTHGYNICNDAPYYDVNTQKNYSVTGLASCLYGYTTSGYDSGKIVLPNGKILSIQDKYSGGNTSIFNTQRLVRVAGNTGYDARNFNFRTVNSKKRWYMFPNALFSFHVGDSSSNLNYTFAQTTTPCSLAVWNKETDEVEQYPFRSDKAFAEKVLISSWYSSVGSPVYLSDTILHIKEDGSLCGCILYSVKKDFSPSSGNGYAYVSQMGIVRFDVEYGEDSDGKYAMITNILNTSLEGPSGGIFYNDDNTNAPVLLTKATEIDGKIIVCIKASTANYPINNNATIWSMGFDIESATNIKTYTIMYYSGADGVSVFGNANNLLMNDNYTTYYNGKTYTTFGRKTNVLVPLKNRIDTFAPNRIYVQLDTRFPILYLGGGYVANVPDTYPTIDLDSLFNYYKGNGWNAELIIKKRKPVELKYSDYVF